MTNIMATSDYYKKEEFIKDLKKLNKYKRPKQMASYIGSILDRVLDPLGCGVLVRDIEKAIKYKRTTDKVFEGLDLIYKFSKQLVWISNNISGNKKIDDFFMNYNLNKNSVNNWPSIIEKYKDYLKGLINGRVIKPKTSPRYSVKDWNVAVKKLQNTIDDILSLKGTNSLLELFPNGETEFVKKVLENSYFLSSDIVSDRFKNLAYSFSNKQKLVARKSEDKLIQNYGYFLFTNQYGQQKSIPIDIDSDGNKAVKDFIETNTGYFVSGGYDSHFQYYIISHIWGNAFDPRYFTNFWNIVIVPVWANFLLDKPGSNDELALKAINTFKAICIQYYDMNEMNWGEIDIDFNSLNPDSNYIVHGTYHINVIDKKKNGNDYGIINADIKVKL